MLMHLLTCAHTRCTYKENIIIKCTCRYALNTHSNIRTDDCACPSPHTYSNNRKHTRPISHAHFHSELLRK